MNEPSALAAPRTGNAPTWDDVGRARREALEEAATRAEQWAGDDLIPFITARDAQIRAHIVAAIRAIAPQGGEQADAPTLEERVRHLELYGTAHVDSWIEMFAQRLDRIESAGPAPQSSGGSQEGDRNVAEGRTTMQHVAHRHSDEIAQLNLRIEELKRENARLREALKWYAGDGSTYDGIDVGQRARAALGKEQKT